MVKTTRSKKTHVRIKVDDNIRKTNFLKENVKIIRRPLFKRVENVQIFVEIKREKNFI